MNLFKKFSTLSILLAGGLWGLMGIFVRLLNGIGLDNMQLLFFRSSITAPAMLIWIFFTGKEQLKIKICDWWYFFGTGILSFLLFCLCYFYTIIRTSMSVAAILLYTAPFFVTVMSAMFFKEKITPVKIMALLGAATGCLMICGNGSDSQLTPVTVLTGLGSGFCYALYSIFGRVALKKYSSMTVTAYTFIFAAIGSLLFVDFGKISAAASASAYTLPLAFGFAVISALLPYTLYTGGLKYTEPSKASIMATFELVVASISGVIVFDEKITAVGIAGIALVLLAVAVLNLKPQKPSNAENIK